MKKVLSVLTFVLLTFVVNAQYNRQPIGSPATENWAAGWYGTTAGLHFITSFPDTAAANAASFIKNIKGFEILVGDDLYLRSQDLTHWIKQAGGVLPTPNLQQVTDVGNTTNNNIFIASGLGHSLVLSEGSVDFRQTAGSYSVSISPLTLTGTRFARLQDASGTIAYLTDIPAAATYYNSNVGSGYRLAIPNTNNIKTISAGTGITLDSSTSNEITITGTGGTVTSVGALSPLFTTATATTTPTFSLISQSANKFFASPDGSSGVASFRSITTGDLPSLASLAWLTTGNTGTNVTSNWVGPNDGAGLRFKAAGDWAGHLDPVLGNTSFGIGSMHVTNSGAGQNAAFGRAALAANTTGNGNAAFGSLTLSSTTTATGNSGFGYSVMGNVITASNNSGFGAQTLNNTILGMGNTAVGYIAGFTNNSGSHNTYVGDSTGLGITSGSGNSIFGARVTGLAGGLSNNIILSDGDGNIRLQFTSAGAARFLAYGLGTFTGTATTYPAFDVSGNLIETTSGGGTVTGTGTANTMTKWTGTSSIGNSTTTDDGVKVSFGENIWFATNGSYDVGEPTDHSPRRIYVQGYLAAPQIYGGIAANDDITIEGTSSATKTTSYVNLQPTGGNVGIGTTSPSKLLQIGTVDPVISLKQTTTAQDWQIRNGLGGGITNSNYNIYDATNSRVVQYNSGIQVAFGSLGTSPSIPSETLMYLLGSATHGATFDARPFGLTGTNFATIEVEDSNYSNNGRGVAIEAFSKNNATGTTMGYANDSLSVIRMNNAVTVLVVQSNTSLRIGTNNVERLEITNAGLFDFKAGALQNYSAKYNDQTGTTYTLLSSDNGKIVSFNNGSAITLTVPASLPTGFTCTIVQLGAGQVTFTASSTTINNRQSYTKTAGQYAVAAITMYAADTFITGGDMQ